MKERGHQYLIRLQYLGFRYSGWQKQPGQKTIEGMLYKTLKFVLPDRKFKILGAGRTDAKVSALNAAFELFLEGSAIADEQAFLDEFNINLPADIRISEILAVDKNFNVIHDVIDKEYIYLFSFGQKNHPYCAPFLANIIEDLDITSMQKAAALFVGTHDFTTYTVRLREKTKVIRTVNHCEIDKNDVINASFFPRESWKLSVCGKGFMRYQIRMMIGALIQVGMGELNLNDITRSLVSGCEMKLDYIAPGSGLLMHNIEFE